MILVNGVEVVRRPDWAPLERVGVVSSAHASLATVEPDSFMYMGCVTSCAGIDIHLYKHIKTRRYLNLDRQGHAYRLVGTIGSDPATVYIYELLPDLASALWETLDVAGPSLVQIWPRRHF